MIAVVEGRDWSEIGKYASDDVDEDFFKKNVESHSEEDGDFRNSNNELYIEEKEEPKKLFDEEFFKNFANLSTYGLSPYNLGVYSSANDKLRAVQYVGVVPLLSRNDPEEGIGEDEQYVVKISSRFGISPSKMLNKVMNGRDCYDNDAILTRKNYSKEDWFKLVEKNKYNNKHLFGRIDGLGNIELPSASGNGDDAKETDIGIQDDIYGVFEIMDFVDKAKELCRKNLKKQSRRVEENLNCKVKGRILVQKQIKHNVSRGQVQKMYCAYNKMSENIKENEIIKYTLYLCQHIEGIGDMLSEDIRFCMNSFRGVPLKKSSTSDFVGLKNNGAYKQYKATLNSAKKVLSRCSISYDSSNDNKAENGPKVKLLSDAKTMPHFIDMNLLFEYYCRAIFCDAIDKFNDEHSDSRIRFELESSKFARKLLFRVKDTYFNNYVIKELEEEWDDNDEESKTNNIGDGDDLTDMYRYFMASYIPDIVIKYSYKDKELSISDEGVAAVFDAKYSDVRGQSTETRRLRTHQVMFYMKALDCSFGGLVSPAEYKDGINLPLCADTFIDRKAIKGNIEESEKGQLKLYYLPLFFGDGFDELLEKTKESDSKIKDASDYYVSCAMEYLEEIQKELEENVQKKIENEEYKKLLESIKKRMNKNGFKKGKKQEILELLGIQQSEEDDKKEGDNEDE